MPKPPSYPRYLPSGDAAFMVEFGDGVSKALNDQVIALDAVLNDAAIEGVVETVPTFRSLMVHIDPLVSDPATVQTEITALLDQVDASATPGPTWRVPACYEGDLAPDLESVAQGAGVTTQEVVTLHTGAVFTVYMLGFLPGFGYFGGLPEAIALPRRTNPRTRVPAGSVAIAQSLSAIYPVVSPGGWHLIGNTPITLFDPKKEQPALLSPGDHVVFEAVNRLEFDRIAKAVAKGDYTVPQETA